VLARGKIPGHNAPSSRTVREGESRATEIDQATVCSHEAPALPSERPAAPPGIRLRRRGPPHARSRDGDRRRVGRLRVQPPGRAWRAPRVVVPPTQRDLVHRRAGQSQGRGHPNLPPWRGPAGGRRSTMTDRLPPQPGEWIDRSRTLRFTFEGRSYTGFAGDTITSALLANGVRLLGPTFKDSRAPGLY